MQQYSKVYTNPPIWRTCMKYQKVYNYRCFCCPCLSEMVRRFSKAKKNKDTFLKWWIQRGGFYELNTWKIGRLSVNFSSSSSHWSGAAVGTSSLKADNQLIARGTQLCYVRMPSSSSTSSTSSSTSSSSPSSSSILPTSSSSSLSRHCTMQKL